MFFFSDHHILCTVLLTPLFGALAVWCVPRGLAELQRKVANGFALLGLGVALPLIWKFHADAPEPFQFVTDGNWIPSLGVHFRLGLDGISLTMVLLTALLGAVAILSGWSAVREREKEFYVWMFLLQAGLLGVFMSLDFVLFFVCWEALLVPLYLLIAGWGGAKRGEAAMKFLLYGIAGSVVTLLAILALAHARGTFDLREILLHPFMADAGKLSFWLFWGFFLAFAVRVPMFPFHTWFADALAEAPTPAAVMLAGALLSTGAYGFLRISVPMLPVAALRYQGLMIALSLIAIVYAGFICVAQKDLKRLVAYASISQMGFCTLGIFTLTPLGLYGSVLQQVSHGVVTAALLIATGILSERRGAETVSDFGGWAKLRPRFAAIFTVAALAAAGLPLLSGFIAEFTVLRGAYDLRWSVAAWAVLGIILVAGALLLMIQRTLFGAAADSTAENSVEEIAASSGLADLNLRELAPLGALLLVSLWVGIYPGPLLRTLKRPVERTFENAFLVCFPKARAVEPTRGASDGQKMDRTQPNSVTGAATPSANAPAAEKAK
ncbi:MAG TPA: NADH-quinone oxidoreductase subunit M [Candidatus Acidoferrales bacterium]